MIRKKAAAAAAGFLWITLLAGCGATDLFDRVREMEHKGGPFQNDLESARAYMLDQLQEKYGVEFFIVGNEKLENYGPLAGATYSCQAAPINAPEQVANALVSQTRYQNVRDNYAVYFFKEAAESPVLALCEEKDYLRKKAATLEMPETAATWSAEDGLERFLSESGAYVRLTLYLEDDLEHELYAEQILDFLNSVDQLECNLFLQVRANKTYLFFSEINARDGFDAGEYTVETLVKRIKQRFKTGDPR